MISRHSLFAAVFATVATISVAAFAQTHPQSIEAARAVAVAKADAQREAARVTVLARAEAVKAIVR